MKKLLVVVGALVVLVIAAAAILPRLLDVNHYHDRIQTALQQNLGRQVQLGQMSLGMLPPTFKVQNAVIGEDPKFNSGMPFAQTAELNIRVKLAPLFHKEVQVESLQMVRPQVELIRSADGTWNFSSIGTHAKQQTKEEQASGQNPPLELSRFQIVDGALAITDEQKHEPRMQYKNIDLLLKDYAPGKPFEFSLSTHLPGGDKQVVKLDGKGGPIEDATMVSTPFEGTLQLDQVALTAVHQYLNSKVPEGTNAIISGTVKFKNDAGKVAATGTVRMDNVVAHGKPLGFPIELNYNASDDLKAEVITVSNTQVKLGSAPFVINGTVNGKSTPPLADLKVNAQNAPLADVVKVAEAAGAHLSPGMEPSGQLTADLTVKGPLKGPAIAGTLKTTQLKVHGVEANSLLVTLNMAPLGADVVKTLTGKVSVDMTDGKLTQVNLSQKLSEIGKSGGANAGANQPAGGGTNIQSLTGDFDLNNGVATTYDLRALTDVGTVTAAGTASLVDQGLNMKATAVMNKASSQQVGGSSAGGVATMAMANNNGELVVPVLVTGTIPNPKVEPDVGAMAKMRLNPGALTQGALGAVGGSAGSALGAVTGQTTPGAAANNQQQKGNSLQNEVNGLGGLFGGKKQQPQPTK